MSFPLVKYSKTILLRWQRCFDWTSKSRIVRMNVNMSIFIACAIYYFAAVYYSREWIETRLHGWLSNVYAVFLSVSVSFRILRNDLNFEWIDSCLIRLPHRQILLQSTITFGEIPTSHMDSRIDKRSNASLPWSIDISISIVDTTIVNQFSVFTIPRSMFRVCGAYLYANSNLIQQVK